MPSIPGHKFFKGSSIHSHSYRSPEIYADKRVLVLGCKSSGRDISLEIAKHAKSVIISHRDSALTCELPENISQVGIVLFKALYTIKLSSLNLGKFVIKWTRSF